MSLGKRHLIVPALLLATLWSGWQAWNNREKATTSDAAAGHDYVLHDFQIVALDAQGKESVTLRAPRLARNSGDETLDIDTPLFLLPDANGNHWQLAAATGWVSADGQQMILRGGVKGDSPADAAITPTTFRSDTLTVYPRRSLAETADAVEMTQPGLTQRGVGMRVDAAANTLSLLSQVKTRYEPSAAR
ncbi:MAG: LPS export ABC transporter periplasmic protein LptC [Stenotrophomonas sp.]